MSAIHAADLALLTFRCGLGVVMLAHGWNHIWGGGKVAGTARWFESMGMRPNWWPLGVAVIGGVGSAIATLGFFWRPKPVTVGG